MINLSFRYCPPSQNVTSRRHWSSNKRDVDLCTKLIWAHTPVSAARATSKRQLRITSFRSRKCADSANFVGGCKYLVDAIVRRQLLKDDSDQWAVITYAQRLLSELSPELLAKHGRVPVTVLDISDITQGATHGA